VKTVKVALVGYGYWGPNLARVLNEIDGINFHSVIDSSREKRESAKHRFSVLTFESVKSLISSEEVDALVVATPASSHDDITLEALQNNLHVLVEKPMATNVNNAKLMIAEAEKRNLVLMPGHTFIFNDAIYFAKQLIDAGEIGQVQNIYSQRLNLGQLRTDVDVVWNLAPHDISIANFFLGSVPLSVSVTAGFVTQKELADIAFISSKYKDGTIAHHHVSWLDPTKTRRVTVIGSKGMLVIDDASPDAKIQIHQKFAESQQTSVDSYADFQTILRSGDTNIPHIRFREPLREEVSNFVAAILGKDSQRVSSKDGLNVVRTLTAISESIKQGGKEVKVPND
jgi:predicted dehydrogenase